MISEWNPKGCRARTIEALHDVLKNEFGREIPCGRLGANAAWLRLAVMTHNILTGLKRLALPEKWLRARPKRMRFQIFCSADWSPMRGRLGCGSSGVREQLAEWIEALRLLPIALRVSQPTLRTDYRSSSAAHLNYAQCGTGTPPPQFGCAQGGTGASPLQPAAAGRNQAPPGAWPRQGGIGHHQEPGRGQAAPSSTTLLA